MPKTAEPWSLTSLREKLIKIGAKVVSHGRYVTFQMAEVAVPRQMFQEILSLIARLRALRATGAAEHRCVSPPTPFIAHRVYAQACSLHAEPPDHGLRGPGNGEAMLIPVSPAGSQMCRLPAS